MPVNKTANKSIPLLLLALILVVTACSPGTTTQKISSPTSGVKPPAAAEVVFKVEIPANTPQGITLYLDILDEVTGLGLNPLRYTMQNVDQTHYVAHLPLTVGSMVKYRYTRDSQVMATEATPYGKQVRYRMVYVPGTSEIVDSISAWTDMPYVGGIGRIQGVVKDAASGNPLADILIAAGGLTSITASDGSYLLDGLKPGTHNLLAYSIDGSYKPYQQGAAVALDSTTPAIIDLEVVPLVNVTFIITPPKETIPGMPIRMVGNIYSLGNTFSDVTGGMSVVASRAPLLSVNEDGKYLLTLRLPKGLDLRYKYTLGDGFWNAEHQRDTGFRVRDLLIPESDVIIQDTIETWNSGEAAPVTINVEVPENTPTNDVVSIQFNPYGWTEPIPMWRLGNTQWMYILYSPLDMLGSVSYRFCRNDQCDSASELAMQGINASGYPIVTSTSPQTLQNKIESWAYWGGPIGSGLVDTSSAVVGRGVEFIAGIELQPGYFPSWQPYYSEAFQDISNSGSNLVILTPGWSYSHENYPVLEPVPGKDALWFDDLQMMNWGQQKGLNLAIFPVTNFDLPTKDWWDLARRDAGWWQSWFDRYRTFILNFADMASQSGAKALVLGEPGISPALPNGTLADGSPSGVPEGSEKYWRQLISQVRQRYNGIIIWAIPYPENKANLPSFISDVDQIYVLWSNSLKGAKTETPADISVEFGRLLDEDIKPLQARFQKPIIIGINYASVIGALAGCWENANGCQNFSLLNQPQLNLAVPEQNLNLQGIIYQAALIAINQRNWISGFVSRGYYAPVALQDASSSIRSKPAYDILKYWFSKLLTESR